MTRKNANSQEGWSYKVGGRKKSHNTNYSVQAQIIYTLAEENRPLTRKELITKGKITESSFYRNRHPLLKNKKIKYKGNLYALSFYEDWIWELEKIIRDYSQRFHRGQLSIKDLANAIWDDPDRIKNEVIRLLKKYRIRLGEESKPSLDAISLKTHFT